MSEHKENICTRIKMVKNWLSRAENSLEQDNNVRAQLDLMLAEAEMKNLRLGSKKNYAQSQIKIVFSVISVLFIVFMGYWYFTKTEKLASIVHKQYEHDVNIEQNHKPNPVNAQKTTTNIKKTETVLLDQPKVAPKVDAVERPIEQIITKPVVKQDESPRLPVKADIISDGERRLLVRKAQQSLHGYNKDTGGL